MRNKRWILARGSLPSWGSPTFHSTQVRTVLKPSPLIFDRSSFQSLGESGVMASSIGARALPPLYQTATGKNAGASPLLWLPSESDGETAASEPRIRILPRVEASTLTARARRTNDDHFLGTIR